ncbi:MAG TPA: T9SS type A sorting domain-containing protein [bacterium]
MRKYLSFRLLLLLTSFPLFAQSNEWSTQYVTFDDGVNGTGDQTSSVAVVAPNRFVAIVAQSPPSPVLDNLFSLPGNYLVGYWDADSADGRVPSLINKQMKHPDYNTDAQFTDWISGLDEIRLAGAWQLASGKNNYVYVANNDQEHNILVFELTETGVVSTDFRMTTGSENIFAIEVDTAGYVYVIDYEGSDPKTNEVKVFAPIGAPGTTWGDFGGHNDTPATTIDLPPGIYQGLTVSGDGSQLFISATSERSLWKYVGDPENGYTPDNSFQLTLAPDDTIGNGGFGTPSFLGLAFFDDPPTVFAAVDSFIHIGSSGGYPYGRIYQIDANTAVSEDTIDIAEWNFRIAGDYATGSSNGRVGGFASVIDVDVESTEPVLYTQTYYGWAVEKWVFDGVVSVEQIAETIPEVFSLKQNYPNPFNPNTTIEFELQKAEHVTLSVYNVLGRRVATLVNQRLSPGTYKATFDASGFPSGVFFYSLEAGNFKSVKKMVMTK